MHILFLISNKAKISELKKINLILNDLINNNYFIYLLNIPKNSHQLSYYLKLHNYSNYKIIGLNETDILKRLDKIVLNNKIEKIIVLGLTHFDYLSLHLEKFIGTNIDLYFIVPMYNTKSDAVFFINQGAYLMNHIDDLKNN